MAFQYTIQSAGDRLWISFPRRARDTAFEKACCTLFWISPPIFTYFVAGFGFAVWAVAAFSLLFVLAGLRAVVAALAVTSIALTRDQLLLQREFLGLHITRRFHWSEVSGFGLENYGQGIPVLKFNSKNRMFLLAKQVRQGEVEKLVADVSAHGYVLPS